MPFIEINLNYFLFPEPTFESDNNSPIVRNCDTLHQAANCNIIICNERVLVCLSNVIKYSFHFSIQIIKRSCFCFFSRKLFTQGSNLIVLCR